MNEEKNNGEIRQIRYIKGYELQLTCSACPEQYDVFNNQNIMCAYLRLRHGWFYAAVPDVGGKIVYQTKSSDGDGCFEDNERLKYLNRAIIAIDKHYKKQVKK